MAPIFILIGFGLGWLIGKYYRPSKMWMKILFSIGLPAIIYGFVLLIIGASYNWSTYMMGAKSATTLIGCAAMMIALLIFVHIKKASMAKEQIATDNENNPQSNATPSSITETNESMTDTTSPKEINTPNISEKEIRKDRIGGYISIGIVVLICATFIGIRLYTKHLEQKNYEAISQIIQKDPNILNGTRKTSSDNIDLWNTYSNEIITFQHPSTYKISDESEDDGLYQITIETKSSDISMIHLNYAKSPLFSHLSREDKKESCISALSESKEELQSYFSNFTTSAISPSAKHTFDGYSFTYEGSFLSIPIQGEAFIAYSNNCMIVLITQAENETYQNQLNKITETITFR